MTGPAVQRWRVAYRRVGAAAELAQRDASSSLQQALVVSGLPIAMTTASTPRPRIMLGPPMPVGMIAAEEVVDLFLIERQRRHVVRERLGRALPSGHELLDLHDVWIGARSLASSVTAADYRALLTGASPEDALASAIAELMQADRIDRRRERGGDRSTYDLRPFIEGLHLTRTGAEGVVVEMRLGIDQQRGIGRPEEVLAELRERTGLPLDPAGPIVRGRLYLSAS
jgi:radical SAM-linked protein